MNEFNEVNNTTEPLEVITKDVQDARQFNRDVLDKGNKFQKLTPFILDFIIVGSAMIIIILVLTNTIPENNRDLANIAVGSLLTLVATIINFWRGTSSGSKDKNAQINRMLGKK